MDWMTLRLAIPAYSYPHAGSEFWARLAKAAPALALVVANPGDGPGTAPDPNYAGSIALLRSRGVDVVGYVRTTYGDRGVAETLADVDRWSAWYQVAGIFFDEVSTTLADVGHYRVLASHVRSRSASQGRVIFNPGTQTAEEYMPLCDVVLNFEGSWATYCASFADNPSWVQAYSASRFWHLIYGCPSASAKQSASRISSRS